MKFMKLGSKADAFQTDGDNNIRYVASELSSDLIVNVVDVKFCVHKFPLLSKSGRLQKLVAVANADGKDEIYIQDFPGGPTAFETCAKFCYGMTVTLNAYNVVGARCAADYLEMYETVEKGNLVYKIDVFLSSSIFRGWKDSIIVLQTTKPLLQGAEELKLVSHCIDAVASKASVDISQVEWSYTYNRKKLSSENEQDQHWKLVPNDWWVEDLCDLDVDLYKRVISAIKAKGRVCGDVIGEALKAYAMRRLPGFSKGTIKGGDPMKNQLLVETIARLLPRQKGTVACSFLLRLLRAALLVECGEIVRKELMIRIGWQLDEASAADLLIRAPSEAGTVYDVDMVQDLVKLFVTQEQGDDDSILVENPYTISDASKGMVAKLVDCYLAEISRDPNLQLSSFMNLAELVSPFPRPSHDGLYRAIDTFLKDHPGISKSERKRICKLMDCRKLSVEACTHAVQNERLPLRMVVQVLFFEQVRASTSASNGNSEVPGGQIRALLPVGSHGSSRSAATTNTEEDWDGVPTTEELKALKGELANLRLGGGEGKRSTNNRNGNVGTKNEAEKVAANKVKGLLMSKRLFSKLWSNKDKDGDNSSSDTSESPASTNGEEIGSTPSRSRRRPLS